MDTRGVPMGKIAILPDILCNQIAAGEVVERPAAVVKELLENSIDAGSSKISVSLIQGGRKEIRVVDNGCGMHPDDALMATERHATSKIASVEDLASVMTLGFRGEALPSIASVSRFELVTREASAVGGTRIRIEGGVLRDVCEAGCPPGTQVLVRDLFHNTPARQKFMRTAETELAYITDQFFRISLAHPEIHFQLSSQERLLHDFPKAQDTAQRAAQVFGRDLLSSFVRIEFEKDETEVSGYLCLPQVQRTNSQSLFLYVNGRPVWDRLLQRTVLAAYEALIPRGKYPVAAVFIRLSPAAVDVNVHPAKREIRFKKPGEVMRVLREALLGTLSGARPTAQVWPAAPDFFPREASSFAQAGFLRENQASFDFAPRRPAAAPVFGGGENVRAFPRVPPDQSSETIGFPPPEASPEITFASLPVIGQLANSFLLLEAPDGLVIIDQHAAHERVLFNRLLARTGASAAQLLTRPELVHLMPGEAALVKRWLPDLREMGFELEHFGGTDFSVHAVPAPLSEVPPAELIRDLLKFAEEDAPTGRSGLAASLAKVASCRGAVKAGMKLKPEEIRHLLEMLDDTSLPFTCPHGRPLWFKLSYDQILRSFKRT
jgi:DNA mismatch repair protein MutL